MTDTAAPSEQLDRIADSLLSRWQLRADGPARRGPHSVVLPVRTEDRLPAVLTVRGHPAVPVDARHEHLVLRRWGGVGAVQLLRADPHEGAVLTERLQDRSLASVPDADACAVVADLYHRLHVPAMPQLDSLRARLAGVADGLARLPRNSPLPHRLVEQAAAQARELAGDDGHEVVLHGDLHDGTVLAGDREPWLAVSPRPLNGDPHWEVAPMLWRRTAEAGTSVRDGLRHRFFALVDAAGLDDERARLWTTVRVMHTARVLLDSESSAQATTLTYLLALAKAVQD